MFSNQQTALDGTVLASDSASHPCGLIAKYFFSDTYEVYKNDGSGTFPSANQITMDQDDISHSYDDNKFKNVDGFASKQWLDLENGPARVWF